MATTKICKNCGLEKSLIDFSKDKRNKSGVGALCKPCDNFRGRMWNASGAGKTAKRNYGFLYHYKITPQQYDVMVKGGCDICGSKDNLHIDHDHNCCPGLPTCGKCIRGVLCHRHNMGEGYFKTINEIEGLLSYRIKWEVKE